MQKGQLLPPGRSGVIFSFLFCLRSPPSLFLSHTCMEHFKHQNHRPNPSSGLTNERVPFSPGSKHFSHLSAQSVFSLADQVETNPDKFGLGSRFCGFWVLFCFFCFVYLFAIQTPLGTLKRICASPCSLVSKKGLEKAE